MVALIKINEEKISNTVSPLLNKTVGLGIDELRLIAGGPDAWQKNGFLPSSEQFRLAGKIVPEKDTTRIVNLGKTSNEEIKSVEKPTQEILKSKGNELLSSLKEESMTIANEDPNLYMKEVLQIIDSPCNKYLEKQYKEVTGKKIANNLIYLTTLKGLALNPFSGISEFIQGLTAVFTEAAGNEFYSDTNAKRALGLILHSTNPKINRKKIQQLLGVFDKLVSLKFQVPTSFEIKPMSIYWPSRQRT